jgi:hypothetical protein
MEENGKMGRHILDRVAELRQEIRDLHALNEQYWNQNHHSGTDRQIYESRRTRLLEITSELQYLLSSLG